MVICVSVHNSTSDLVKLLNNLVLGKKYEMLQQLYNFDNNCSEQI